jgi:hypothetical protein
MVMEDNGGQEEEGEEPEGVENDRMDRSTEGRVANDPDYEEDVSGERSGLGFGNNDRAGVDYNHIAEEDIEEEVYAVDEEAEREDGQGPQDDPMSVDVEAEQGEQEDREEPVRREVMGVGQAGANALRGNRVSCIMLSHMAQLTDI